MQIWVKDLNAEQQGKRMGSRKSRSQLTLVRHHETAKPTDEKSPAQRTGFSFV